MNKMNLYQLNEISKAEAAAYDELLKNLYGDKYGAENRSATNILRIPEKRRNESPVNYGDYPVSGFFSIGNSKLPKDTMIIDFNSAHHCPSISFCPVSSLVCYAARGEDRFKDKMRKNLEIEDITRSLIKQWKAEGGQRDAQGNPIGGLSKYLELAKALILKKNTAYNNYIKRVNAYNSGQSKQKPSDRNEPTPVRYVRFNEVGDFPNEHALECAVKFAEDLKNSDEYAYYEVDENKNIIGVKSVECMAYTANRGIKNPELWKRAARAFAINASVDAIRDQFETGEGEDPITKREYNATHGSAFDMRDAMLWMDKDTKAYKDAERLLATNPNESQISDKDLENLEGVPTEGIDEVNGLLYKVRASRTLGGDNSVPLLRKGVWPGSDGEQWYYVCPCSYWALLKDALKRQWLEDKGYEIPMTSPKFEGEEPKPNYRKLKWRGNDKAELEKYLKVFQSASPCGTKCHVCYNMNGGRNINNLDEVIYDYHVLSAIHGGGTPFWNQDYYNYKRREGAKPRKKEGSLEGDNEQEEYKKVDFMKYNRQGRALYGQKPTDAYFYGPLWQDAKGKLYYRDPEGNRWEKEEWEAHVKDEIKKMKAEYYEKMLKKRKEEAEDNLKRRRIEAQLATNQDNQITTEARSILRNFRSIMEAINRYEKQKKRDIFDW